MGYIPADLRSPVNLSDSYIRAILATAMHRDSAGSIEPIVARKWPQDKRALALVRRSATIPADTTTSHWASELAATGIVDLLSPLGAPTASAELFRRSLMLSFGSNASLSVPAVTASANNVAFTQEGAPVPVHQLDISGAALNLRKLGSIFCFTDEVLRHSAVETLTRAVVGESLALGIDKLLFDANTASAVRPAGLLAGLGATAATSGGTVDAMRKDLGNLAAAVAPVGGLNLVYVASPDAAAKILLEQPNFRFPVLASGALAAGIVICIAPAAFAVAIDPMPRIETAQHATLHADTVPLAIATIGSPNAVSAPVLNLFQAALTGVRFILRATWALRSAGVSWTQSVTW
jgi:hypothetical protein